MMAGQPVERPKLVPKPTRPKFVRAAAAKKGKVGTPRLVA
jgi:hypothetical protein